MMTNQSPQSSAAGDRLAKALQAGRDVVHGRGTGTYDEATDAIHLLLAAVPGAVEGAREAIARVEAWLNGTPLSITEPTPLDDIRTLLALLTSRPDGVASVGSRPSAVQASDRRIAARTYAAIIAPEPVDIAGFMSGKFDKSDIVKAFVEHRSMESAPLLSFDHCRDFWPTGDVFNRLGAWLSAALDDPNTGEAFKADIRAWLEVGGDRMPLTAAPSESVGFAQGSPAWCAEMNAGINEMIRHGNETQASFDRSPKSGEVGELREATSVLMRFTTHGVGCALYGSWANGEPNCTCGCDDARTAMIAALAKPTTNGGEIAK